ncbi:MAG: RDD family protein [Xanthobacteraceae bacterium]|nr:RDD family protein [Xanthobacteraceae bacterium]PWB61610.1 MAG: RDD family protein [Bradyrhizobiaceae bacterium]GIK80567.1 MAG: RDD family protein [Alphaproteobacteria bacterium]
MAESEPKRIGVSFEVKPHVYDPDTQPELFEGVMARRVLAFVIDLLVITVPLVFLAIFIFVFGIVTLGLGWLLFFLFSPIAVIWAVLYYGLTLGSPASATLGMRVMEIEMRTWYGGPCYFLLGAVHAILFWVTVSFLTPLILLVAFFNARRRLLHDLLLGTVVINNELRAAALRRAYPGPAGTA